MNLSVLFSLASLTCAVALLADHQPERQTLVNRTKDGLALQGYDPVAYFTDHKPVKGAKTHVSQHRGATYRFASADHRAQFDAAPERFAPAYGGYCGYAASIGKVRPANPLLWSIVDGQLVVQHTRGAAELWEKDVPGNKAKADRLWPRLVEAKAGQKDPVDSLLGKSVLTNLD